VIPNLIGNLPDWRAIRALADDYNLAVVEDSADTLGATIDSETTARFSNTSVTSFYGSHVINCAGNGGMLCTDDDEIARSAKLLRSWGRSSSLFANSESVASRFDVELDGIPYDRKFVFEMVGHNFEPSEIGAAFGLVQLDQLKRNIESRERNFERHTRFFERYENWFTIPKQLPGARTGWLAYPIVIRPEAPFSRRDFQIALETADIQTRTVFTGNILRQPGFRNLPCKRAASGYPEADRVMRGGVLLACHHGLSDQQMAYLHQTIEQFLVDRV